MTTDLNTVEQAEFNLKEARHQKSLLQKKLNTLKAKDDTAPEDTQGLEEEIEIYDRETIPALRECLAHEQAQSTIARLLGEDTTIMTDEETRAQAAAVTHRHRLELQQTRQKLQDNSSQVMDLIDALQQDQDANVKEGVSFPGPTEVVIHGQKYSANGGADLRFLATRAVTLAWPN